MSILLKIGDKESPASGLIYLNATTEYSRSFSGTLSSNPLDAGAKVSDHFTSDNPKFTIAGVISGVDFSPYPSKIELDGEKPLNVNESPEAVEVSNLLSSWGKLIPDSVGQFLPNTTPQIKMDTQERQDSKEGVETLLEEVMTSLFFNEKRNRFENKMTLVTMFEVENGNLGRSTGDLVITSYNVKEDPESGDALFISLTLEKARFSTLQTAEAPQPEKGTDVSKQAATTKDKGTVSGEKADAETKAKNNDRVKYGTVRNHGQ